MAEIEALLPINHPSVSLPSFEGPLDLLLFLIRKNEIDIYDIPIEKVTRQYLDIIKNLEEADLELTGEFFVMAATLMVIKSRMLLPPKERTEETVEELESPEEDPRWELVQQLLEYKRLKERTDALAKLITSAQDYIARECAEAPLDLSSRPLKNSDKMELWNTFNRVLRKLAAEMVTGTIHEEQWTVAEQMERILTRIASEKRFYFSSLFELGKTSINGLVTAFLAILELSRLKQLVLEQSGNFEDILCLNPA